MSKVKYTSFTQKYKEKDILISLKQLILTPEESFELTHVDDLNELSLYLKVLIKIDISNNFISKLILTNFINLKELIAQKNIINEVLLDLPKLQTLNLSANLLKNVPNLSTLVSLNSLNLSKNLITSIQADDFLPCKMTLTILDLSYNKINFQGVNDFLFFAEKLKCFNFKEFSIHGNEFIDKNKTIANSYVAFLSCILKNIKIINGQKIIMNKEMFFEEDIRKQMLIEEKYLNKNKNTYYSTFKEYYNKIENINNVENLSLTPSNNFLLIDLEDLNLCGNAMVKLEFMDLSDNLIKNLKLGGKESIFPKLKIIKASKNLITTVDLRGLVSLSEIDLSNNNLSFLPDFNNVLGKITKIYLNNNKIQKFNFENIKSLDSYLNILNVSNNSLDFQSENEISEKFIKPLTKYKLLSNLKIDENPFYTKIKLKNFFEQALYSEFRKILSINPNSKLILNGTNVNCFISNEKSNDQKLENDILNKNGKVHNDLSEINENEILHFSSLNEINNIKTDNKKVIKQNLNEPIIDLFIEMNNILERLNECNGDNQYLRSELIKVMYYFLSKIDDIPESNTKYIQENYEYFLMNCNELLELIPSYETQILKILAQIAIIGNLEILKYTLSFFKSYIMCDNGRINLMKNIIETIIVPNLQLLKEISFNMITEIIDFLKVIEVSCDTFFNGLILNIVNNISEKYKTNEIIDKLDEQKKTEYENYLNFVIKYLKNQYYEDKNTNSLYNIRTLMDEIQKSKNNNDGNSNIKESDTNSILSESDSDNNLEPEFTLDNIIEEKASQFNPENFNNYNSKKNFGNEECKLVNFLREIFDDLDSKIKSFNYDENKILGCEVFEQLIKEKYIPKIKQCPNNFQKKYEYISYFYIFLNCFKLCYMRLTNSEYFISNNNKGNLLQKFQKFDLEIKLLKTLISTYNENLYPYNNKLFWVNTYAIFINLNSLITDIISAKKINDLKLSLSDAVSKENKIDKGNLIYSQLLREIDNKQKIKYILGKTIIKTMKCLGFIVKFLPQKKFIEIMDSNLCDQFFNIIIQPKNDPDEIKGAALFFIEILKSRFLSKYELLMSNIFQKVNYTKNLLTFIDQNEINYKKMVDYYSSNTLEINKFSLEENSNSNSNYEIDIYDFRIISNKKILSFLYSIVDMYLIILKLDFDKNFHKIKPIMTIINELNNLKLFTILGNLLKILKDDTIRLKAIQCLYYVESKYITNEIIFLLIHIISGYSSICEGQIEDIISMSYFILNNKLLDMIKNNNQNYEPMMEAIKYALIFLQVNSERHAIKNELIQKNILTLSLITFLTTASRLPFLFKLIFQDENNSSFCRDIFKNIISNDFFYLNQEFYVPIEIERTYLGMYLIILFDNIEGNYKITPYSYVFLRLLIQINNVVSYCKNYPYEPLLRCPIDSLFINLINNCEKKFIEKVQNESKNWYYISTDIYENENNKIESFSDDSEDEKFLINVKKEDKNLINKVKILLEKITYYTEKYDLDSTCNKKDGEENKYFNYYPKPSIKELIEEQIIFLYAFPNLFYFLLGEKSESSSNINDILKRKYFIQMEDAEKIFDILKFYNGYGKVKTILGDIQHIEKEIPFNSTIYMSDKDKNNYKDLNYLFQISNVIPFQYNSLKKLRNKKILEDLISFQTYGINNDQKRIEKEENVNNPHLRSLIICAFLRGVYSMLISPSVKIREEFIEVLFIDDKYKYLLLYCSTQNMYNNYNIYIILEEIFKIENLKIIIKACAFSNRNLPKANVKLDNFLSNLFDSNLNKDQIINNSLSEYNIEINLFKNYYFTSIFLERELNNENINRDMNNFCFMLSYERAIYSFLKSYLQTNFYNIDEKFRYVYLIKQLATQTNINIIFKTIEHFLNNVKNTFNKIKKLKRELQLIETVILFCGIYKLPNISNNIKCYLIKLYHFLVHNFNENTKMLEILAIFGYSDKNLDHLNYYHFLDLTDKSNESENNVVSNEYPNQIPTNKNNSKNVLKYYSIIEGYLKVTRLISYEKKILSSFRKINDLHIILSSFCFLQNTDKIKFNQENLNETQKNLNKKNKGNTNNIDGENNKKKISEYTWVNNELLFILTKTKILFYFIDPKNNELLLEAIKEFEISKISNIYIYEYSSKLIIQLDQELYLIKLKSTISVINLLNKLIQMNGYLNINKLKSLDTMIQEIENNDPKILNNLSDIKRKIKIKDINIINNIEKTILDEIKPLIDQKVKLTNNIIENIYKVSESEFYGVENCFLCKNLGKIIYFSKYCIYIINEKENFNKLNIIETEEGIIINNKIFNVDDIIYFRDIVEINNNFKHNSIEVITNYKKNYNLEFHDKLDFYFANFCLVVTEKNNDEKLIKQAKLLISENINND